MRDYSEVKKKNPKELGAAISDLIFSKLKEIDAEGKKWAVHALPTANQSHQNLVSGLVSEAVSLLAKKKVRIPVGFNSKNRDDKIDSYNSLKNGDALVQVFLPRPDAAFVSANILTERPYGFDMPLPWPFGRVHVPKMTQPPSDAYMKFYDILMNARLMRVDSLKGKHVVELGSHPGGWTWLLLELGAERIDTVDWADMSHPSIQSHKNVNALTHHLGDAKEFKLTASIPNRVDILVSDVAMPPNISLDLLEQWLEGSKGAIPNRVIWAVKFGFRVGDDSDRKMQSKNPEKDRHLTAVALVEEMFARHPEFEYTMRQVYNHGNEAVILAHKKTSI